jgi:hypothetical protein
MSAAKRRLTARPAESEHPAVEINHSSGAIKLLKEPYLKNRIILSNLAYQKFKGLYWYEFQ